jgi:hypothetical protein
MFGSIIPTPFAIPAIVTARPSIHAVVDACFGRVSGGHDRAGPASPRPSGRESACAASAMPRRIFAIGSG